MVKRRMTYEEAKDILLSAKVSDSDFAKAKKWMKYYFPYNPSLTAAAEKEAAYQKKRGKRVDDAYIYRKNLLDLRSFSEKYTYKMFKEEHKDLISQTLIKGENRGFKFYVSEVTKDEYFDLALENAKFETVMDLVGSEDFYALKGKDKEEAYVDHVNEVALTNICRAAVASEIEEPKKEEKDVSSKGFIGYIERQRQKVNTIIEKILKGEKEEIIIKADQFSINTANTIKKAEIWMGKLKTKASKLQRDSHETLQKIAAYVGAKKNKLAKKADKVTGGRYSRIVENFKENKLHLVTNLAATALLSLSGYGTVALLGYGAYMIADAWINPIIKEATRMRALKRKEMPVPQTRKERFEETKSLLADAHTKLKKDPKYNKRAIITTIVAAVSFGALAKYASAINLDAAKEAGDVIVKGFRKTFSLVRAGVANMVQLTETAITGVDALKNKNDIRCQKEFKSSLRGLGAGLVTSSVAQLFAGNIRLPGKFHGWFSNLIHKDHTDVNVLVKDGVETAPLLENAPERSGGLKGMFKELFHKKPADLQETGLVTGDEVLDTPSVAENVSATIELKEFPENWSKDMTITENQFNTLTKTMDGSVINDAGEDVSLNEAYSNLTSDVMKKFETAISENGKSLGLEGKALEAYVQNHTLTPEQVLYRYNRLNAFDGIFKKGGSSLKSMCGTQNFSKYDKELTPLMRLLAGDEDMTPEQYRAAAAILDKKTFNDILSKGSNDTVYMGSSISKDSLGNEYHRVWSKRALQMS